jgi:hypothetical protein
MAFLVVTTVSFFIKSIAFSRVVIVFGFIAVVVVLSVMRWVRRELNERRVGQRQAVLVGPAPAAERFKRLLMSSHSTPLEIVGYVEPQSDQNGSRAPFSTIPRLGRVDQLRDIVRLRHIDDIIFAAGHVSNQAMFTLMQDLLDLPIQFKILQPRQTQVLGKSFVGEVGFSEPLLDAEAAVSLPRGRIERRLTHVTMATIALLTLIVLVIPALLMSRSAAWPARLRKVAFSIPALVSGRYLLVGFDEDASYRPPTGWGIERGIVSVIPSGRAAQLTPEQIQNLYWRYTQSQSLGLDVRIILSYIRSTGQVVGV